MLRTAFALAVLVALVAATGCTMCCHPYDYCGPVRNNGCLSCSPHARVNSVLADGSQPLTSSSQPVPQMSRQQSQPVQRYSQQQGVQRQRYSQQPTAQRYSRAQPVQNGGDNRQAMEQIAAQRTAQSEAAAAAALRQKIQAENRPGQVPGSQEIVSVSDRVVGPSTESSESPQVAADSGSEAPSPLPSKGWTARRPTSETLR